tara:strand:- start:416 stop:571 length:156 start_codon:yes stop_codon:yes gene_type:complete
MDYEETSTWVMPPEPAKMKALRKCLNDIGIEYAIMKKDGPLVTLNMWIGED